MTGPSDWTKVTQRPEWEFDTRSSSSTLTTKPLHTEMGVLWETFLLECWWIIMRTYMCKKKSHPVEKMWRTELQIWEMRNWDKSADWRICPLYLLTQPSFLPCVAKCGLGQWRAGPGRGGQGCREVLQFEENGVQVLLWTKELQRKGDLSCSEKKILIHSKSFAQKIDLSERQHREICITTHP